MSIVRPQANRHDASPSLRLPHDERFTLGSAFINGAYRGIHEASAPIVDLGFIRADAAYDVVTVSKGAFFRLEDHLSRMEAACQELRLANPYNRTQTREILTNLVQLAGTQDAYIWWSITRGALLSKDCSDIDAFDNGLYAFLAPYAPLAEEQKNSQGLDIQTRRKYAPTPGAAADPSPKNFHWMDRKMALFESREQAREWDVLTDHDGYLTEAPGATLFIIKHGELYTPDIACQPGMTHKSLLEPAQELGIPAHVTRLHKTHLLQADEAFICTCAGTIAPIISVDDVMLENPQGGGSITGQLYDLYRKKRGSGWQATEIDFSATPRL